MKKIIVMSFLMISSVAFAGQYTGQLLEVVTGGIEDRGIKKNCKVYGTQPRVKKNLKVILKHIDDASKVTAYRIAVHVIAQVPSVEIYAYHVTLHGSETTGALKVQQILLHRDHSDMRTLDGGKDTEALISLARELCN